MKRITVKMKDAEKKLYAPRSFFDAMHFGILTVEQVYSKVYGNNLSEENLFERHMTVLNSIPIKFTTETITK